MSANIDFFNEHGYLIIDTNISDNVIISLQTKLNDCGVKMPVAQGQACYDPGELQYG